MRGGWALLPRHAGIVSVGRGTLLVMPDLFAALDSAHLSLALLDVFETEPLPAADPAWTHERIIVSSHVAGFASRPARAESVARDLARFDAGERFATIYNPVRGY